MKLEDLILKVSDSKGVTKAVKYLMAGLEDVAFPLLIPSQDVYEGPKSSTRVPEILRKANCSKALIVTDATLVKLGVLKDMLDSMEAAGFPYVIYDGVEPNPSIENIEDAFKIYRNEMCDCLVGFGGGSAMDAAKVVSCRAVKPNMDCKQMGRAMGYLPVTLPKFDKTPFMIAVPTTAGTGAESTVAAVVSDHAEDKKYTLTDFAMRPNAVILDGSLAMGLPKYPTACTAIDAVSHCVEGYIGNAHNPRSDEWAVQGIRLVFENIDKAALPGSDLTARQNLSKAAYFGGQSLNTATTGYVHPFCHKIGAKYGLVHGRCIGAVLPIMLEVYGEKTEKRVAKLGVETGLSDPKACVSVQAAQFIQALKDFDEKFGISPVIPEVSEADFEEIADSIMVENFVYPTKVVFSRDEIFSVLRKIKG